MARRSCSPRSSLFEPPALDRPAALFLGGLLGLALWSGVSIVWSISPDRTWSFTNRSLVYLAFALLGVLVVRARDARADRVRRRDRSSGSSSAGRCSRSAFPRSTPTTAGSRVFARRSTTGTSSRCSATAGVPIALWLAVVRRRLEGVVLLYALVVTLLLTYSRFGVVLACAVAVVWILVERRRRLESLATFALGGIAGTAVFGIALALPGITKDGQSRAVRAHDGWIFALVLLAGAAARLRRSVAPRAPSRRRRAVVRGSSGSRASPRSCSRSRASP